MTDSEPETTAIVHDHFYPHPIERVWQSVSTSTALSRWLMINDFAPALGHQFKMVAPPIRQVKFDGLVRCEVVVLDPPHHLAYTWNGGGLESLVTYQLESATEGGVDGTHLHFEHRGFDLTTPIGQLAHTGFSRGWPAIFEKALSAYLGTGA